MSGGVIVSVRVDLNEYAVVRESREHEWKRECEGKGRFK